MSLLESSKAITPSASYKPAAITCVWATPGFYKFLDESEFFRSPVAVKDRSRMNVVFRTPSDELDAKFVQEAEYRSRIGNTRRIDP